MCSFYVGMLTFLFFPILVFLAYGADKGYFSKTKITPASHIVGTDVSVAGGQLSTESAGQLLKQLDTANLSEDEAAKVRRETGAE